jgi:uncharacterized protein (TIRG00374 family)
MRSSLKRAQLAIGVLISLAALVLVATRIDLGDARAAFRDADYRWIVPAAACSFASVVFRAARWRALLFPAAIRLGRVFGILAIGQSVTALLPFRLGDVARIYLLGDLEGRSKAWALSTIVLERVLDIITLVVIMLLLLPFVPFPAWVLTAAGVGAAIVAAALAVMCAAWFGRERLTAVAPALLRLSPERWAGRLRALAVSAVDGLAVLGNPPALLRAAAWSAMAWLATGVTLWMTLAAFGIPQSFSTAMFVLVVSAIAIAVPLAPGAVGVYHAAVIEALVLVTDTSPGTAASYAVTTHVLLFLPPIVCGLGYLWREPGVLARLLALRALRGGRGRSSATHEQPVTQM